MVPKLTTFFFVFGAGAGSVSSVKAANNRVLTLGVSDRTLALSGSGSYLISAGKSGFCTCGATNGEGTD